MLVTVWAVPFCNEAAAWSCRYLPRSLITWQIRGDLVNCHAESRILPKRDPKSLSLCFAVFRGWVRPGRGFPVGYVNFTAVHVPVKSKPLEKGFCGSFFVSAFTFISSRFEHKPWGRISAVAPVWLGRCYRSFRSLHHLTDQQQEMLQPWFSSSFKKYALPWPSCMVFYLLKGGLIASPLSPRFPQQPNCKCSQATPWSL